MAIMLNITKDIQSLTEFRRQPAKTVKRLKRTRRPIILTIHGKAEVVIQDAASYQRLLDIAAQTDAHEGIRQGLEDVNLGRTSTATEVFDGIRRDYDIPR